jgi:hypothetical protein
MTKAESTQLFTEDKGNLLFPAKQIYRRCCAECGEPLIKKPKAQRYCSPKCSQKHVIQKIADSRRGKHQREGTKECATCHALIGMNGAMSGRLLALNKTTIHFLRKNYGLRTLSASEATKSAYLQSESAANKITQGSIKQWWKDNWGGVVETYWDTRGVVFLNAKVLGYTGNNYSAAFYYWEHDQSKARGRQTAGRRWHRIKGCPITREKINKIKREWYSKNPEKKTEYAKRWRERNPDKVREMMRNQRQRPSFKCRRNARKRMMEILKAPESFSSLLGCTGGELAAYLEAKFTKKMSWDNYGTYWHIDHIIPLAKFDLSCPKQRALACHWTNLQPLEAEENLKKSDKITQPQMSLLLSA